MRKHWVREQNSPFGFSWLYTPTVNQKSTFFVVVVVVSCSHSILIVHESSRQKKEHQKIDDSFEGLVENTRDACIWLEFFFRHFFSPQKQLPTKIHETMSMPSAKRRKKTNQYAWLKSYNNHNSSTNYFFYVHVRLEESVVMEIIFLLKHNLLKAQGGTLKPTMVILRCYFRCCRRRCFLFTLFLYFVCLLVKRIFSSVSRVMTKKINKNDRRHCQSAMLNRRREKKKLYTLWWFNKFFHCTSCVK